MFYVVLLFFYFTFRFFSYALLHILYFVFLFFFFFQAEDGIRDAQESRGLGDVYKRQGGTDLIACAKGRHCFAHRINDKRHDPLGHPGSHALDKEPNCQFAEVVDHKGKLHLFVVCTKTIAPGEELLLDYGSPYWEAHRDVIADLLHGVANVFNQMSNQFTTKPLTKVPKSKL
eukprot:TRINITY_DN30680_c0_g1_i1.p1 TRINITY_DN30680_c0_g1~~TRINITY_DN30680_c0_g1_i1.p1  ORF type:complete len:173 (-),score=24.04 TRINITY_DN30680_c0_g1_i1:230-748(-)